MSSWLETITQWVVFAVYSTVAPTPDADGLVPLQAAPDGSLKVHVAASSLPMAVRYDVTTAWPSTIAPFAILSVTSPGGAQTLGELTMPSYVTWIVLNERSDPVTVGGHDVPPGTSEILQTDSNGALSVTPLVP